MSSDEVGFYIRERFFSSQNRETKDGRIEELIEAAREGKLEDVKRLVNSGVDVNGYKTDFYMSRGVRERTSRIKLSPLDVACYEGHTDVVKFLIENGANVNHFVDNSLDSRTPIAHAIDRGHIDIVGILLDHGAPFTATSKVSSPIRLAHIAGNVEMVNYLISRGASVDDEDEKGHMLLTDAVQTGSYKLVKTLLEQGVRVNCKLRSDDSPLPVGPLYKACQGYPVDIVELLLAHGADVEAKEASGHTPLFAACQYCDSEILKTLLDHGARVDGYDGDGFTPLHAVSCSKRPYSDIPEPQAKGFALKVLLEHGMDPNKLDKDGLTLLERIQAREREESDLQVEQNELEILLDYGAGSGLPCRVTSGDHVNCETTALMCLYLLHRSLLCDAVMDDEWEGSELIDIYDLKSIRDTYERFFIKTRSAGLSRSDDEKAVEPPVDGVDWGLAKREAFRVLCKVELCRMESDLIGNTGATYFSLLTNDLPVLLHWDLLGELTGDGCLKRYPIYGNVIFSRYVKLRRIILEEKSSGFFAINSPPLLPECAKVVQGYLSERDMTNLMVVYQKYVSGEHEETNKKEK